MLFIFKICDAPAYGSPTKNAYIFAKDAVQFHFRITSSPLLRRLMLRARHCGGFCCCAMRFGDIIPGKSANDLLRWNAYHTSIYDFSPAAHDNAFLSTLAITGRLTYRKRCARHRQPEAALHDSHYSIIQPSLRAQFSSSSTPRTAGAAARRDMTMKAAPGACDAFIGTFADEQGVITCCCNKSVQNFLRHTAIR